MCNIATTTLYIRLPKKLKNVFKLHKSKNALKNNYLIMD